MRVDIVMLLPCTDSEIDLGGSLGLDTGLPWCRDEVLSGVQSDSAVQPPSTENRLLAPNPLARIVAGGVDSSMNSENSL